jgi:hypothetical protein
LKKNVYVKAMLPGKGFSPFHKGFYKSAIDDS